MRLSPRLLLTSALAAPLAGLVLSGCATTGGPTAATSPPPAALAATPAAKAYLGASNYGLFLAGEAALQAGRSGEAAQYFSRAAEGAADQPADALALIRDKAFTSAIMAGDVSQAALMAPQTDADDPSSSQRLARLVRAVDALAENRGKEADLILNSPGKGVSYAGGISLLKPWAAAAAGDVARATTPMSGPAPALTRVAAQYGQALLLERAKRYPEAETAYKTLNSGPYAALYLVPYGEFMHRRGRAA